MKKVCFLLLAISIAAIANAQNSDAPEIKVTGGFISMEQLCRTAADNNFDNESLVDMVVIKKDLITSIVVQLDPPGKRVEEKMVVVTTSEKIVFPEAGVDSKAMSNACKPYKFLFDNESSAKSFALELMKICASE